MDEKQRQAIALAKFSVISPVLSGSVERIGKYFDAKSKTPIEIPGSGPRQFSARTFESWLALYAKYGLDGLMPGFRSDKGKSRKVSGELADNIKAILTESPKMPVTVLYERLVKERLIDPFELSRSTIYRYIQDAAVRTQEEEKSEPLRFSHQHPGELWQGDVLYGPKIKEGKKMRQTYLHAFIDDATRYVTASAFYYEQNFEVLREELKTAMLKNGIPRILYTDNGKIYRTQQLEFICASVGCTLLHSKPYVPQGRGKIERFFRTVRMRFLDCQKHPPESLEELNKSYAKWLDEDYQKKVHSALSGQSPKEAFLSGLSHVKLVTDRAQFDENFLLRASRKVAHDATLQIGNNLFETDPALAGKRLDVRYEPEWITDPSARLALYEDGKKIGEAKLVRFHDNAHVKRKYPGNRRKEPLACEQSPGQPAPVVMNSVSFCSFDKNAKGENHV